MDRKLSAKDKAFEKERVKFRKRIKELETQIKAQEQVIIKAENQIESLKDWVERLLDYCNMTPQELETLLANEKRKNELAERLDGMFKTILKNNFY